MEDKTQSFGLPSSSSSFTPAKTYFISGLEFHFINIFGLKNDGEKWSRIDFEIHRAPSEIPANLSGNSSLMGRFFGTGQQQL